jgi:hypothetical protein
MTPQHEAPSGFCFAIFVIVLSVWLYQRNYITQHAGAVLDNAARVGDWSSTAWTWCEWLGGSVYSIVVPQCDCLTAGKRPVLYL